MNRIIVAAALAACTIVLSPMSFAEESSAFAARFAALQDSAVNNASEHIAASQHAIESQAGKDS